MDEDRRCCRSFRKPEIRSNLIMCCEKFGSDFYIGTYGGGLYRFHPETLTLSDFQSSEGNGPFSNDNIFCLVEDWENIFGFVPHLDCIIMINKEDY